MHPRGISTFDRLGDPKYKNLEYYQPWSHVSLSYGLPFRERSAIIPSTVRYNISVY